MKPVPAQTKQIKNQISELGQQQRIGVEIEWLRSTGGSVTKSKSLTHRLQQKSKNWDCGEGLTAIFVEIQGKLCESSNYEVGKRIQDFFFLHM